MKTFPVSLVSPIRITDNSSSSSSSPSAVERNRETEGKREREEGGKKGYSKETISAQILAFLKWQAKQPPRSFERVLKSAFNSVYSQLENRCLHRQFRGGSVCSIIETRGHEISRFSNPPPEPMPIRLTESRHTFCFRFSAIFERNRWWTGYLSFAVKICFFFFVQLSRFTLREKNIPCRVEKWKLKRGNRSTRRIL